MLFVAIFLSDQAELHHNCDRFLVILGVFHYDLVLIGGNAIDIPVANIKLVGIFLYQYPIEWYKSISANVDVYVLDCLDNIFLEGLVYCMGENSDHKVGRYCNLIGPLDQT